MSSVEVKYGVSSETKRNDLTSQKLIEHRIRYGITFSREKPDIAAVAIITDDYIKEQTQVTVSIELKAAKNQSCTELKNTIELLQMAYDKAADEAKFNIVG